MTHFQPFLTQTFLHHHITIISSTTRLLSVRVTHIRRNNVVIITNHTYIRIYVSGVNEWMVWMDRRRPLLIKLAWPRTPATGSSQQVKGISVFGETIYALVLVLNMCLCGNFNQRVCLHQQNLTHNPSASRRLIVCLVASSLCIYLFARHSAIAKPSSDDDTDT